MSTTRNARRRRCAEATHSTDCCCGHGWLRPRWCPTCRGGCPKCSAARPDIRKRIGSNLITGAIRWCDDPWHAANGSSEHDG